MSVRQLRPIPRSGEAYNQNVAQHFAHRCQSTVQIVGEHTIRWRKNRYGEENWDKCSHLAVVELDGVLLCRRHAGERVLEQYLAGYLVSAEAQHDQKQRAYRQGERDAQSRARNRPGDGDMGG